MILNVNPFFFALHTPGDVGKRKTFEFPFYFVSKFSNPMIKYRTNEFIQATLSSGFEISFCVCVCVWTTLGHIAKRHETFRQMRTNLSFYISTSPSCSLCLCIVSEHTVSTKLLVKIIQSTKWQTANYRTEGDWQCAQQHIIICTKMIKIIEM